MARNDKELEDLAAYKPGVVLREKWKILELLDEGGFGKVYRVQLLTSTPPLYAALKIESTNMDGGSAIKLEKTALERILKFGLKEHVPQLYRSSRKRNICYMIVTLLGDNLKRVKERFHPGGYPLKLWVKTVHDAGFVHRDIKAANFVFGHSGEPRRARTLHIIDFGLARQYALPNPKNPRSLRPRAARPTMDFRGTWYYASPSMHDYVELGRKDDLWSWLFMLIDLYATLPWADLDSLEQIGRMKQAMRDDDLVIKMPQLVSVPRHLRTLTIYNRPDYREIYACLERIFVRCKASWADPYPWENRDMATINQGAMPTAEDSYLNPTAFFSSDPIGINDPARYTVEFVAPDDARSPSAVVPSPTTMCATVSPQTAATATVIPEQPPSARQASSSAEKTPEKMLGSNENMQLSKEKIEGSKEKIDLSKEKIEP